MYIDLISYNKFTQDMYINDKYAGCISIEDSPHKPHVATYNMVNSICPTEEEAIKLIKGCYTLDME